MFAPSHDTVVIKSEPEGAEVYAEVDDGTTLLGKTPLQYSFKRNTVRNLLIKKDGWKSQELQLKRTLDPTLFGNFGSVLLFSAASPNNGFQILLSTTTIGAFWIVDGASGKWIKYSPDSYFLEMERDGNHEPGRPQGYLRRLRFVLFNHAELQKDIARGGGSYLTSYFELRNDGLSKSDYHAFLAVVLQESKFYLTSDDPIVFFYALEKSCDGFSKS